jgi:hypothetical protein
MRTAIFLAASLAAATSAFASWGDCTNTAPRSAVLPIAGATRVVVIGRAGSLKVTGRAGANEVRATGTACTSTKSELADIQLRATRSGGEIRIEAVIPDVSTSMFGDHRLDFEVSLPTNVPVRVVDGSGGLTIEHTAALEVEDGSGELTIRHVAGNLEVQDGSGSMTIEDVSGNVRIRDGSGSIDVHRVTGSVVLNDGSGAVDVTDVGGDFIVESKGSGHVSYDRVKGRVDVPRRR